MVMKAANTNHRPIAEIKAVMEDAKFACSAHELALKPKSMTDDQFYFALAAMEDGMDDADLKKYLEDCVGKTEEQVATLGYERTNTDTQVA